MLLNVYFNKGKSQSSFLYLIFKLTKHLWSLYWHTHRTFYFWQRVGIPLVFVTLYEGETSLCTVSWNHCIVSTRQPVNHERDKLIPFKINVDAFCSQFNRTTFNAKLTNLLHILIRSVYNDGLKEIKINKLLQEIGNKDANWEIGRRKPALKLAW